MSDALEDALRREAQRMTPAEVPAGMERRICAAIDRAGERPAAARRPLLWWASGLTAVAAAALVLALRPASPSPAEREAAAQLAQAVRAMPAQVWSQVSQVQPRVEAAMAENPVRQEGTALASDARAALSFLAYNFLPPPPQPAAERG